MKFEMIESLQYGNYKQVYQSEVLSNGQFKYRLFVTVLDYEQCSDLKGFGVDVEISKTFKALSKEQKKSLIGFGCTDKPSDYDVCDYGYRAILDGEKEVIKGAKKAIAIAEKYMEKADTYKMMLGFYLDKRQNRIGNTGWDFLNGNVGFKANS